MPKIVFLTGAGMSEESGLPTFRGSKGIWNQFDYERVAAIKTWNRRSPGNVKKRRQEMLDFFNPIRRMILQHQPNEGHYIIASFDKGYDVTVITQNGDDYHTRAGSLKVIYLHGEALKNASSANPSLSFPIDHTNPDIHIGDRAPDGSQLRSFVTYFEEDINKDLWRAAVEAVKIADWLVIVGTSLLVYPAAYLVEYAPDDCRIIAIDPDTVAMPSFCRNDFVWIREKASEGLRRFKHMLLS